MNITLMIDLDDTLLTNDINTFLPIYLKALSKHLSPRFPGDLMVRELLAATGLMIKNQDPSVTLETVFDRAFYPALGSTKEDLRNEIQTFYREVFPTLQSQTSPRPEAVHLIEVAFERGYQVVIATNPLFPRAAILHRLAWAGLPADRYPFALITTYEGFHFTKPNPAYYAEILGQLGWPSQPAVMVGNSLPDDISPAETLGLPTYWLGDGNSENSNKRNSLSSQGSLAGILPWLEQVAKSAPVKVPAAPEALIASLKSTPAAMDALTASMPEQYWTKQPAPGEWSVTQILCHLRDVDAEVNWPRMSQICEEDNPFLPGINTDLWAEERNYALQDGRTALRQFMKSRIQLLRLLESLPPAEWQRKARHAIFGPTTLIELVSFIAAHDHTHQAQTYANIHSQDQANEPR